MIERIVCMILKHVSFFITNCRPISACILKLNLLNALITTETHVTNESCLFYAKKFKLDECVATK